MIQGEIFLWDRWKTDFFVSLNWPLIYLKIGTTTSKKFSSGLRHIRNIVGIKSDTNYTTKGQAFP